MLGEYFTALNPHESRIRLLPGERGAKPPRKTCSTLHWESLMPVLPFEERWRSCGPIFAPSQPMARDMGSSTADSACRILPGAMHF